jgi:hypothetical protein
VDPHAMAEEIRSMGGHEFADPQDVHDTLTGMGELVEAMQDVLNGWGLALAETGVHSRYPEATQEAASQMAGIGETLREALSGGVMHGPGG